MRITLLAVATALFIAVLPVSAQAVMKHYQLNIPRQSLDKALQDFAHQTGLQVARMNDRVDGSALVGPVKGELSVEEALRSLLDSNGLSYKMINERTVAIVKADDATASASAPAVEPSGREASSNSAANLEEVIVTAQKRSERLQDAAVPVTVLDANTLAEQGQNRLQDYYATVPGLNLDVGAFGGGTTHLAIRGLTTGVGDNPTVGVTIDDVPYGSSTSLGGGQYLYPDIDPSDLSHIEVLRGPQGTLYGTSSLGGLIKFVTVDPSTTELSGRVQVLGNDVEHGEFGYGFRGAINVPVSDTLAIRASAFARRDPGYIDNVTTGQQNVNQVDTTGGRLAALWRPSDSVSIKLSAMLQNADGDGDGAVDSNEGGFQQARMRGTGGFSNRSSLYTATLVAKLAGLELTSLSGYGITKHSADADLTYAYGGLPPYDVAGASLVSSVETGKFTQELRLSSPGGHTFEWLMGAFYTHETTATESNLLANDPSTGAPVGEFFGLYANTPFSEYALFGDLTVHFTDRFNVQFGARESRISERFDQTLGGSLFGPTPIVSPTANPKGSPFTYLVTPQFEFSSTLMTYARFASGYRTGGANPDAVLLNGPLQYDPDKSYNYELGIKGDWWSRALSFDASVYYIDWKHIQILVTDPTTRFGYYANAGNAKSQGIELSVQARPIRGLTLAATAAVSDAQLTQDFPSIANAFGYAGEPLPSSSRFSGSFSADEDIALTASVMGFLGGSLSYVGERFGAFAASPTTARARFPAYAQTNLRTGVRHDSWTASLFANNVSDKRGIVSIAPPYGYYYIQPRTVGVSVSREF